MSDMMKMFVEQELQNQIKENYPHMQYPPGLYAKVVSVRQNGELYEATIKILDKNKQPDIRFPEVPKVKTDIPVLKNESVAIVLIANAAKIQMGFGNAVTVCSESRIANTPTCEACTFKTLKNICIMQTLSPAA